MRAAHRLAVYGDHLPLGQLGHLLGPAHETALELLRVQTGEHLTESVVGRDAARQFQESPEPLLLASAEHLDVHPGIGPTDGGANGDGDDVQQLVPLAALYPGVLQTSKAFHNLWTFPSHHDYLPAPAQIVPFYTFLRFQLRCDCPWRQGGPRPRAMDPR